MAKCTKGACSASEDDQLITNIKADILIIKRAIIKLIEKLEDYNERVDKLEERINVLRHMTINNMPD